MTRLFLTRRSFLVGLGASTALAAFPPVLVAVEPVYVTFPGPEWACSFETDVWRHRLWLRLINLDVTPAEPTFNSVEAVLSRVDVENGRTDELVAAYNRAIEGWRQRHSYTPEMVQGAADGRRGRWFKRAGVWHRYDVQEEWPDILLSSLTP